jgi:DTW domain-containing protein YfiP
MIVTTISTISMLCLLTHDKNIVDPKEKETTFILCDSCFWCATYLEKRVLVEENICPNCSQTELSSFLILPNERITYNYSEKREVELKFNPR